MADFFKQLFADAKPVYTDYTFYIVLVLSLVFWYIFCILFSRMAFNQLGKVTTLAEIESKVIGAVWGALAAAAVVAVGAIYFLLPARGLSAAIYMGVTSLVIGGVLSQVIFRKQ